MTADPAAIAQTRRELAACYRLIDRYGMTDLVSTHISARVPGSEIILINRYGDLFGEIRASTLVAIDLEGESADDSALNPAGYLIHTAVHNARPDVACVIHVHSEAGIAVSCQADGLLPISQHALQFYNRIGYHAYEGIALLEAEKARLVADLGPHNAMMLRNHGVLTAGRTIGEAFTLLYNLENACRIQLRAQASGALLTMIPPDICELTAQQHAGFGGRPVGEAEWEALMRDVARFALDFDS